MRSHALFPCQIWQVPTPQVVRCISACVYAALKSSISKNSSLKSAYTHEILRFTEGTFASSKDLSVAGRGFKSSLIKYLAPILYDADRSQLYLFPVWNTQRLWFFGSRDTLPEPSYASLLVSHAQTLDTRILFLCA